MVALNAKGECDIFFVASIAQDPSDVSDDSSMDIHLDGPMDQAEAEAKAAELEPDCQQVEIFAADEFVKLTGAELIQKMWDRKLARTNEVIHEGWRIFFEKCNEIIRLKQEQEQSQNDSQ